MAKSFSNLKNPKSGLLDQITFGKLKGCRICDVIPDNYEYLIWAEKQGFVKFSKEVTDVILEQAHFKRWEGITEQDSQEDVRDVYPIFNGWEDDVPF